MTVYGQLNLRGTLSQTGGTLTLQGGTISGGTIDATAGTLAFTSAGGTLSGVTVDGPLNLTADYTSVSLANGTTVVGSSGSGPGTINDTGTGSHLYFDNTHVSNETINLGNASYFAQRSGQAPTLTLASSVTVDMQGLAEIYGEAIVNEGVIDQTGSGGEFYIDPSYFTNGGTIDVSGVGSIFSTTFTTTASSLIEIGANSYLNITPTNAWSNLGSITLASGAILILDGSESTTGLGSISNSGGTIDLAPGGNLNNSGDVLNGSSLGLALEGGTITGGRISGLAFTSYGGTLSGVTFDGPLNLAASSATVHLANGTTVVGLSGSGPGTINDTGTGSQLYFDNTQTVSNETINLGNSSSFAQLYGQAVTLTLASSVTVDVQGLAEIYGEAIVNEGMIDQTGSGGEFYIEPSYFTNSGTIDVEDGGEAIIEPTTITNLSSNTPTGGTYEAQASSTLEIYSGDTITTDDADIILSGAGCTIETYNRSTRVTSAIDTTLTTIGSPGELQLLAGRGWTTAKAAITNDGVIQLGGGTLTSTGSGASLTDGTGSRLIGFGTVTATTFLNSGTIEASGGTLTLTDAVSGTGDLDIDAGATLVLAAAAATTNAVIFNGANGDLQIDGATMPTADISGFAQGDTIDLTGASFASGVTASLEAGSGGSGSTLAVSANGTTYDLNLAEDPSQFFDESISFSNDGNGGTNISLIPPTTAVTPDVMLQNTNGQLDLWQVNGATLTAADLLGPVAGSSWFEEDTGAFYSGDASDVVWQNNDGEVAVWRAQNAAVLSRSVVADPGPSWHIRGTGDFYNDGHTDLLWQNDNGSVALWELNGAAIAKSGAVSANPGPSWHIEGTGDFYDDGHTDVLWQNDDGAVALWELNGTTISQSAVVSANSGPSWRIKGTGDFYGDGKTDILWQNDNGTVAIWEMNGATISKSAVVADPGPTWHVVGTGDFNQDGKTDIVLQNDNGAVAVWDMNGAAISQAAVVADPGPAWSVSGDGAMRFIQSGSAGEILAATPTTPEEFVFTNYAAGAHTIAGFNPVQDIIELPLAQFGSFAAVQEATSAIAGGAEINLGHGSSLLLPGVNPAALHVSNFALA